MAKKNSSSDKKSGKGGDKTGKSAKKEEPEASKVDFIRVFQFMPLNSIANK